MEHLLDYTLITYVGGEPKKIQFFEEGFCVATEKYTYLFECYLHTSLNIFL